MNDIKVSEKRKSLNQVSWRLVAAIELSLFVLFTGCRSGTTAALTAAKNPAAAKRAAPTAAIQPQSPSQSKGQATSQTTTAKANSDRALISTVNVKLVGDKVEVSQPAAKSGDLAFNISNNTAEPLAIAIVKTKLDPSRLRIKDGRLSSAQPGVEMLAESALPIDGGRQATLTKALAPGEYQVLMISPSKDKPMAYAQLSVKPL